jgi:hypothetical protein
MISLHGRCYDSAWIFDTAKHLLYNAIKLDAFFIRELAQALFVNLQYLCLPLGRTRRRRPRHLNELMKPPTGARLAIRRLDELMKPRRDGFCISHDIRSISYSVKSRGFAPNSRQGVITVQRGQAFGHAVPKQVARIHANSTA